MSAIDHLRRSLPSERILTADEDVLPYAMDGTAALMQRPEAVVFPCSTEEVVTVLRWAGEYRVPVTTRGTGTGLSGGAVPCPGGIVLCLARMNRVLEVDRANLCLLAEPGVTTAEIAHQAATVGLFYPPDPGSMKISTVGGNVANNSGGLRGLKYGVTRDYVMGLEAVLPDASTVWLGSKCVKDVAGLSLKDLFIGSEGTLGVITKILLRLLPRPAACQTLLATYDSLEKAAAAVSAIIAHPIIPCTLEFLDRTTLRAVEAYAGVGLPADVEALLLMETDGHPAQVEEEAEAMARLAVKSGALEVKRARDAQEAQALASARRAAFSALARVRPTTILEDVTVPRSELTALVRAIRAAADRHGVQVGVFGHFGDGNVHPTFLTNERDAEEMRRVEQAMRDVVEATIRLGGTITGEHGVGLAKKPFMPIQFREADLRLLSTVKSAVDPHNLLNPGKIWDGGNTVHP